MISFHMKRNTGLKWVYLVVLRFNLQACFDEALLSFTYFNLLYFISQVSLSLKFAIKLLK